MTPEYIRLMDLNHHVDACLMANLTEKVYDHKTFSEIETSVAHFQAAGVLHVQHGRPREWSGVRPLLNTRHPVRHFGIFGADLVRPRL